LRENQVEPLLSAQKEAWVHTPHGGGLEIARALAFLAECQKQSALWREFEDLVFQAVQDIKIELVVFADRGDGTEEEIGPLLDIKNRRWPRSRPVMGSHPGDKR